MPSPHNQDARRQTATPLQEDATHKYANPMKAKPRPKAETGDQTLPTTKKGAATSKRKTKSKKRKKSKLPIIFIASALALVLICAVAAIKRNSTPADPSAMSSQQKYDSWVNTVSSGGLAGISSISEMGNDSYLYREISYNNDNPIYADMKQKVLSTVRYALPQVEEQGLFNKGQKRVANLNKDGAQTVQRVYIDWSKVPVNEADLREAVAMWQQDSAKRDSSTKDVAPDDSAASTNDDEGSDKAPSPQDYTISVNNPSYAQDSAEVFAEWCKLIADRAQAGYYGVSEVSSEAVGSAAEDAELDQLLFSGDAFSSVMLDVQNQLYLISGGNLPGGVDKRDIMGLPSTKDVSNDGADAPVKAEADTKEEDEAKEAESDAKETESDAKEAESDAKEAESDKAGEGAKSEAGNIDLGGVTTDPATQSQDASTGIQYLKGLNKSDVEDVLPDVDGVQVYDYDTDIKGIQTKDGAVYVDEDDKKDGVQLKDGTTITGIQYISAADLLKNHRANLKKDLVTSRWVMDKTWVGSYRLNQKGNKVSPQLGKGTLKNPASVGTKVQYTQRVTNKGGKEVEVPISVTLTEFRVGADAIKWYQDHDSRNRGFDPRSNVVQVGMVFRITNLGNEEVTIKDDSSISTDQGDTLGRTGTVYNLRDSLTLKPGESGTLETWTGSTAITDKYIIWGSSYMADKSKSPIFFRVLKDAIDSDDTSGKSAQEMAGTAGTCSNAQAGCLVQGDSSSADQIPGTSLGIPSSSSGSSSSDSGTSSPTPTPSSSSVVQNGEEEPDPVIQHD